MAVRGFTPPAAKRLRAPPLIVRPDTPVTATRSEVVPNSKLRAEPTASVRLLMVSVPAVVAVAAESEPPGLIVTAFSVPVPPSVPPVAVTADEASDPFTTSVPLATVVRPV